MKELGQLVRNAKIGLTKLHLQCPVYGDNPGNVCFTSDVGGHHWVSGWVNICDSSFAGGPSNVWEDLYVHEVLHHEPSKTRAATMTTSGCG